jgi:outer membrane protein OmpA-like peptidoglycan-associated protein
MKTVLLIPFFLLSALYLNAQEKSPAELKELFYDAEFFFVQEEYVDALYDYVTLYNSGYKDNANINYLMGICYLNIPGQKEKSIDYLLEAIKNTSKKYKESSIKQQSAPVDAWLFLGNAYRVNNKLNDAIAAYSKYKEVVGVSDEIKYADQQIAACNTAIKFMETPLKVKFTNLGDSVNGASSNFKGVISGNGRVILYMNELPFYNAVYFSKYTSHGWSSPVNITPQIQSDGDQYVTSVSWDGATLYLTKEDAFNSDIYVSHFANDSWSRSVPVEGQDINTKFWESHASISADGKTLYFTSNRKDGLGEMDLYVSKLQNGGYWGQPVNMGDVINTPLNEDTPFITGNDSILYFSSQGHENMGGYDVFVTRLNASGQWSTPANIRYPLNTTDDDLFYYPWHSQNLALVSRIMDKGFGKEDIYAVQPYDDKDFNQILADFVKEQTPAAPVVAEVTETPPATPAVAGVTNAIPEETKTVPETTVKEVVVEPVVVKKPASPKEIELEPVYFGFDNFQLSETGKKQLEKVRQFLTDYPASHVRFVGHADSKGPAEYNQKLSEQRAKVAKKYITDMGIDTQRIETLGMGERNFAAINNNPDGTDNPEGRQLNRRVEYELIGNNELPLVIKMPPVPEKLKFRE